MNDLDSFWKFTVRFIEYSDPEISEGEAEEIGDSIIEEMEAEIANEEPAEEEYMEEEEEDAAEVPENFEEYADYYNEIRQIAYMAVENLTGMQLEGMNDDSSAYLHSAYFSPLAAYRRHTKEGVRYPRSLRGRPEDERSRKTVFSGYEARQDNTGGAFVRGKGPASYHDLFCELKKKAGDLSDAQIAGELVNIFEGNPSQLLMCPECRELTGKIMTIFCYAETQRHPVALLEAYTALKKYRDDALDPETDVANSLSDVFNAEDPNEYTPLFVPRGGARMIRGDKVTGTTAKTYRRLLPNAAMRMASYYQYNNKNVEDTMAMIVSHLLRKTDARNLYPVRPEMVQNFERQHAVPGGNAWVERFEYHEVNSVENNCAFDAVAAILQKSYDIQVRENFALRMRELMGIKKGIMVELIGDGERFLNALRYYFLLELGFLPNEIPNFVLHAVINFTGELVDMQDIAHTDYRVDPEAQPQVVELNLLYDGINHFDALLSDMA